MKTLFERNRMAETAHRNSRPQLVRTYVETGDPRCPLASIWMQLAEPKNANQQSDREKWCPGVRVGDVLASRLNPVIYEEEA